MRRPRNRLKHRYGRALYMRMLEAYSIVNTVTGTALHTPEGYAFPTQAAAEQVMNRLLSRIRADHRGRVDRMHVERQDVSDHSITNWQARGFRVAH